MGYPDKWTAVSRPPYFTALALWSDCGGAFFSTNVQLYVHGSGVSKHHPNHPPTGLEISMDAKKFFEQQPGWNLWRIRAERDGWKITPGDMAVARKEDRLRQYVLSRRLIERSDSFGDAPFYDLPQLDNYSVSFNEKDLLLINNATWADWDQRNRLVYAIGGKLYACEVTRREIKPPRTIAEFNNMEPESIAPPDWASHW